MSVEGIRETLVETLYDINATKDVDPAQLTAFQNGARDIRLGDLRLGSLGRMELLVALEIRHGAVIAPEAFLELKSLDEIVALALRTLERGTAGGEVVCEPAARCEPQSDRDEPEPPMVRVFRRALRSRPAVAQLNKLLKLLEHRLTPPEFLTLRDWHARGRLVPAQAPARFGARVGEWLDWLGRLLDDTRKPAPEPFAYVRVAPAAVHFVGPGERAGKTLLICFPMVGARQMWMPNALLLQHTDARQYDVLVLSDLWRTGFRAGVPMMGGSVTEIAEWLSNLEWIGGYGRVRTFGCSAGAYPAMLAARHLKAELGVGIGGRFPKLRTLRIRDIVGMYVHCWAAARRSPDVRVLMVYGQRRRDRLFARHIALLTGASRLTLKMPGRKVPHNLVRPLIEQGELGWFLRHTLFAPVSERWLAGGRTRATLTIEAGATIRARELTVRGRGYRRTRIAM